MISGDNGHGLRERQASNSDEELAAARAAR